MVRITLSTAFVEKFSNEEENIEFNPSKCTANEFKEFITLLILQTSSDVTKSFTELENKVTKLDETVKDLETAANAKDVEIKELSDRVSVLEAKSVSTSNESDSLKKELNIAQDRTLDLERYTRSFNLRFLNIPESSDENCIELLKEQMRKLKIQDVEIENAHRIGERRESTKQRGIIARFSRRPERKLVLNKRREFFNIGVPVYEDLCKPDLEEKKKHAETIKQLYNKNHKVFFSRGQWYVDGRKLIITNN